MSTQLTWLGHGTWSIEVAGTTVLLDPYLDDCPTATVKSDEVDADFILVSHGHFDHVADVAPIAHRTGATVIANLEICDWLGKQQVEKTEPMNIGGTMNLPFGRVTMTMAQHSSGLPDGNYGGEAGGFLLRLDDGNVYFACDTALFLDMRLIGSAGLDLAVLPIGDRFTMGPDDSLEAIKLLSPRRVVPCHYDTWPPIRQDPQAWAERVRVHTQADPIVVRPGETISL
jgi:L-ascorbate metabolism protein UlaG (beta-lactamase superfamily)